MKLTESGNECCGDDCFDTAYVEFGGHCGHCWVNLGPEERAILQGKEPPVKEIITHTQITTHYPPKAWLGWRILAGAWRAMMTAAVLWLAWRVTK